MTAYICIFALFLAFILLCAVIGLAACMRSSQISREEEEMFNRWVQDHKGMK